MLKVLITGCSMHSYDLIKELRNNYDGEEVHIVGVNSEEKNLLKDGVDSPYIVPRVDEESYVPELIRICNEEKVDVIMPFITYELMFAAEYRAKVEKETGAKVSVASKKSLMAVSDKDRLSEQYPELMPRQICARTSIDVEVFAKIVGYPEKNFCCKLPDSCGGNGFCVIDEQKGIDMYLFNKFGVNRYITIDMLTELVKHHSGPVILQEYEEGTDYSVCVLADKGKMLYALGFEAYVMSYGSAMRAEIKDNEQAYEIARRITFESGLDGNACFDFILKPDGTVKLLEVNPRLSATLPFIARAGLNLPYLRCMQLLGKDISHYKPKIQYGLKMSKTYVSNYS